MRRRIGLVLVLAVLGVTDPARPQTPAKSEPELLPATKAAKTARDRATATRLDAATMAGEVAKLEKTLAAAKQQWEHAEKLAKKTEGDAAAAEDVAQREIVELAARLDASRAILRARTAPVVPGVTPPKPAVIEPKSDWVAPTVRPPDAKAPPKAEEDGEPAVPPEKRLTAPDPTTAPLQRKNATEGAGKTADPYR